MRTLLILLIAALTVSACGRRGALEPPPGAEVSRQALADDDAARAADEPPDRPFILDPLL